MSGGEKYNAVVLVIKRVIIMVNMAYMLDFLNLCGNDSQKFMNFDYLIHR